MCLLSKRNVRRKIIRELNHAAYPASSKRAKIAMILRNEASARSSTVSAGESGISDSGER